MEERLPPRDEEGPIFPKDVCPYDSSFCFRGLQCLSGDPYGEGLLEYCPRYPMD